MIRDHYRNTDIHKAKLDPSTFDAEQFQPHPTGLDWFVIAVWGALFCASGLAWWGIIAGVQWVWGLI